MSDKSLTIEQLKFFNSFADGDDRRLQTVTEEADLIDAEKGQKIIELGDTSDVGFFLLEGTLILKAGDGGVRTIEAKTESAKNQIAQLIPRRYQVIAATPVRYFKVPNALIRLFTTGNYESSQSIVLAEAHSLESAATQRDSEIAFENEISYQLYQDLKNDKLMLPSLPDIAVRIGKALQDENKTARHIAELVQADPAIAAKLLKAANSPLYAGTVKVESVSNAVVRLGTSVTHKLVMTFAIKDLFKTTSSLLNRRMKRLWSHSTRVAAISHVLARKLGRFDPEQALLGGLLHDIGILAILYYALDFPEAQSNKYVLDNVIKNLRGQIGSMILRKWEFPESLQEVPANAENWMRSPETGADYSDLVIVAQLHSYIGSPEMTEMPAIDSVPAFKRLKLSQLTPTMSLKILDEAKQEIEEVHALLA